jgi:hypothetical protein
MNRQSPKDTCRLLASGAHEVHWLRVLRSEVADGAAGLLACVPVGRLSVCESNSLRTVIEPGLFLQVRAADSKDAKPSARSVAHLADGVVLTDGRSFDLELDRISVVDRQWVLRREACAVVVVGDEKRHQADRAAALCRTRASLEPQFDRVTVEPRDLAEERAPEPPTELSGPPGEWCLVTPPLEEGVPPGLVNALFRYRSEVDVVVAETGAGGRDVGLALCRRALVPEVIAARGQGVGAVTALGDRCKVRALRSEAKGSDAGSEPMPAAAPRAAAGAS